MATRLRHAGQRMMLMAGSRPQLSFIGSLTLAEDFNDVAFTLVVLNDPGGLYDTFAETTDDDDIAALSGDEVTISGLDYETKTSHTLVYTASGTGVPDLTLTVVITVTDVWDVSISSYSPADNATDIAIDTDLVLTFGSTVVLGSSGTISLKLASDDSTVESWNVATEAGTGAGQVSVVGGTALTMRLTSDLDNNVAHYVVYDAGVVTSPGGASIPALSAKTTWNFTTVSSGYTFVNAEAETLVNSFSVEPDDTRKAAIDTLIGALKANGNFWANTKALWVWAAHDAQAANRNWKNPGTYDTVPTNAPTFTTDRGYTGIPASSAYLSIPAAYDTIGLTQNSAHIACWVRTAGTVRQGIPGRETTNARYNLTVNNSGNFQLRVSTSNAISYVDSTQTGYFGGSRPNGSDLKFFINGSLVSTQGIASEGVGSDNGTFLKAVTTYSDCEIMIGHIGLDLTDAEWAAADTAFGNYKTAVGA